jgi:thiol-disulfide isomerase/thioredoxin
MIKVIRFTSTKCEPCKTLAPIFDQLKVQYTGKAQFQSVDVDFNKIYLEIPKGFTEILGYVTLREKPRVRFADGKWLGIGGNECKQRL